MTEAIRILFVEDSEDDIKLALRAMHKGGLVVSYRSVQTQEELQHALESEPWTAVISDFNMPGFTGLDALKLFHSSGLDIPFILVSGTIGEEVAVEAMRAGASDYLMKKSLARLAPALQREIKESKSREAHRQAQAALVESEARYRSLSDLSSDWYWELDENFRFTAASLEGMGKFDERAASWLGKTRWELPYMKADWAAHREVLRAHQSFVDVDIEVMRSNGTMRYMSISGEPRFNRLGVFCGYRGVGKDTTEKAQHVHDLQRLHSAMDATADAIYLVDRSTLTFVYVNAAACMLQECSCEELMAMGPDLALGSSRVDLAMVFDEVISHGTSRAPREFERVRKDGSTIWVESRSRAHRFDASWMIVTVVRDITDRKLAESKIAQLSRVKAVLSGINALILREAKRESLFTEACEIAVRAGGFRMAWLAVPDESSSSFSLVASTGLDDALKEAIQRNLLARTEDAPRDPGFLPRIISDRKARVFNDLMHESQSGFGSKHLESGIRSVVFLPLMVSDVGAGVLVLCASEPDFFQQQELDLLSELADNIAFAVDHIEKQARLDYLAFYDVLTGLANRKLFFDRVTQAARSASGNGSKMAVYIVDIERFKNINDSLGRPAGDAVLKQVADWLAHNAGDAGLLARVGSDQFAALLPQVRPSGDLVKLMDRVVASFSEHSFVVGDVTLRLAVKFGVALFPEDGTDADTLFKNAEAALKNAKQGGSRYLFYNHRMTANVAARLTLENQLRRAYEQEQFVLHYQPKLHLGTGKLIGAEALIRWNDPSTGLVPPGRFIPVLEQTGLIHEVGRWALRKAVSDYLEWKAGGLLSTRIAVNVSALQLRDRGFVAEIHKTVSVDPEASFGLELEITESLVMEDVKQSIAILQAVRDLGVTVAIDDFGTGFSSLSYLAKLPIDTLKIDQSFIADMLGNAAGSTLVGTIITLAHAMNLKVVAEGVETVEQERLLSILGCDAVQGYLYSKAVPRDEFESGFLRTEAEVSR